VTEQQHWPGPDPDDITAWLLVQAGHLAGRRFTAVLGDLGLTPIQFGVLLQLDLHPAMSNGEIARSVLVTPQSMSELLGSLERLGLVERESEGGRGRRVRARLTPAGRQTLEACSRRVAEVEASLGLTATEARQINALLRRLLR